jgi:hypothetical protein
MSAIPVTTCEPWVYRVSPFPADSDAGRFWSAWVRATGDGRWKVLDAYQSMPETFLTTDGLWTMDRHEFICFEDFDEAVRMATEAVQGITVNGLTINDAAERFARSGER